MVSPFQSTPLMRGETRPVFADRRLIFYFNPLPSCEGRHSTSKAEAEAYKFQSTPLMRGETRALLDILPVVKHFNPLPSCEGRPVCCCCAAISGDFNPLPSCEGRLAAALDAEYNPIISIHSPHARGDRYSERFSVAANISIHSPHARGDVLMVMIRLQL